MSVVDGPWRWAAIVAAGLAGGWLNAVAGGGSLVAMPVLVLAGLPPTVANATNNVGTTVQSLAALVAYWRRGVVRLRVVAALAPLAGAGAALGAVIVVAIDDRLFARIVGVLMVLAGLWTYARPQRATPATREAPSRAGPAAVVAVGALGVYGGFFGGGVGILLLAVLTWALRTDLVHANGIKAGIGAAMNATAFVVFAAGGLVAWREGIVLAACMTAGTHVGVRLAVRRGDAWVRRVLLIVAVVAAGYFLFGYP